MDKILRINMGTDHTAGYAVISNLLGMGIEVDSNKPDGQIELPRNLRIATAAMESAPFATKEQIP